MSSSNQSYSRFAVVWFKRDLRLQDHAPLVAAMRTGLPVLALYCIEPSYWRLPDASFRHWLFIRECLVELDQALRERGNRLVVLTGNAPAVLESLRQRQGQFQLFSHEETGNDWTFRRDKTVKAWAQSNGILWDEAPSHGVVRQLETRDGWQSIRDKRMAARQVPAPDHVPQFDCDFSSQLPAQNDALFGPVTARVQTGGRHEGVRVLDTFLGERSRKYMQTISKPGPSARHCSRLSAHIAYGSLSVREVDQAARAKLFSLNGIDDADALSHSRNLKSFRSRLAWRCHFVQKLEQQPSIEFRCIHPAFEGMREPYHDEMRFNAWVEGKTGYPLVDASMRSLQENGWINFRMRAMLVSFASYHLWLDWRVTAPVLARLFTDYEPGIHFSQFQMQSGVTGMNAIRMYNPIKQSLDHDPEGKFIRRFAPELSLISSQWIHEPWRMETPPDGYPMPVVDHEGATAFARAEISKRWRSDGFRDVSKKMVKKLGSRNRQHDRKKRTKEKDQLTLDL